MLSPIKLHGLIVATGFLPYFIAESMGVNLPMVGLAELDPAYVYSPIGGLMLGMLASLSGAVAYSEITETMTLKTFTFYHYPLAAFVLKYMMGESATLMGKMFFFPPLVFTAWSSALHFGGKGKKA